MKNIIPLIVSVILGLASVFVVSRLLFNEEKDVTEDKVNVVVAARNMKAGEELYTGSVTYREVSSADIPRNAILWENVNLVYGQKIPHAIMQNDFVLTTDIQFQHRLSDYCRTGEWTIPVTFSDPALVKMLSVGDEIAILATQSRKSIKLNKMLSLAEQTETSMTEERETSVLLPCVRVLDIPGNGNVETGGSATGTIFISLPPQQAMIVVAAQREAELYPVLRKQNDSVAMNRKDGGIVTSKTLSELHKGFAPAELPETPNQDHR